MKDTSNKWYK
jgi:heme/copper-type cytochrome/quinol oxidase subunit 1